MPKQKSDDSELLVVAMARPAMIGGFTMSSIGYSLFLPGFLVMLFKSLTLLALVPVALLVSYMVCLKDIYLFDIFNASCHLKACRNKAQWGYRSYAPR